MTEQEKKEAIELINNSIIGEKSRALMLEMVEKGLMDLNAVKRNIIMNNHLMGYENKKLK